MHFLYLYTTIQYIKYIYHVYWSNVGDSSSLPTTTRGRGGVIEVPGSTHAAGG